MEHSLQQQAKRCFADRSTLCCRRPDRTFAQYRVFLIHAARGPTARSARNAVISWRSPLHRCWTANCRNTNNKAGMDTNFLRQAVFREVNKYFSGRYGLGYLPIRTVQDENRTCYNAGSTEDNYGRITILLRDVTDVAGPITGDTCRTDASERKGTEKARADNL